MRFLLLFVLFHIQVLGQDIPLKTWRTHFSYFSAKNIAISDSKVFCATSNGFFSVDRETNEMRVLSKIDGLHGSVVDQIAYYPSLNILLAIYDNGNIDFITEEGIIESSVIQESDFNDKKINQITFFEDLAFLSTAFGVVVYDLTNFSVKESYLSLGENASQIKVFSSSVLNDSIYLGTRNGILSASLASNINRQDYRNWSSTQLPGNSHTVSLMILVDNRLLVINLEGQVFTYVNGDINLLETPSFNNVSSLQFSNNQIIICDKEKVYKSSLDLVFQEVENENIVAPVEALVDTNGFLWVADSTMGLINISSNEKFIPNGALSQDILSIDFFNGKIVTTQGNFLNGENSLFPEGFSLFDKGSWSHFTNTYQNSAITPIPEVDAISCSFYDTESDYYYFGSRSSILKWKEEDNSFDIVRRESFEGLGNDDAILTDINKDKNQVFWATITNSNDAFIYQSSNAVIWSPFYLNNLSNYKPKQLLVDDFNQKWMISEQRQLIVFNNEGVYRAFSRNVNSGNLPNSIVNDMVKDFNGSLWIGTDEGIAVFINPADVLTNTPSDIFTPRFEGRPLLQDETVLSIAIDGANRKWIGTNNGAWLFSPDGSTLVEYFNSENSPLPSDKINAISINPISGEVFFSTSKGLVSFRSDATSLVNASSAKIFPNPVYPNFSGTIGITGVPNNSVVKITDISNNLIWETTANGTTATWRLTDLNGNTVSSGIYLVYSASNDGLLKFSGKIAVIR